MLSAAMGQWEGFGMADAEADGKRWANAVPSQFRQDKIARTRLGSQEPSAEECACKTEATMLSQDFDDSD